MPSAHSAIAFCLATAAAFISKSAIIATITFMMAFMVAESRIEGEIHTTYEVVIGGIIGILITVFFFQIMK